MAVSFIYRDPQQCPARGRYTVSRTRRARELALNLRTPSGSRLPY
jgi:hypothetical protein